jgi:hypothetical protein
VYTPSKSNYFYGLNKNPNRRKETVRCARDANKTLPAAFEECIHSS